MIVNAASIQSLSRGFSAIFNKAFEATESHLDKIAMVVPSTNGEENYAWIGKLPMMREWVGARIVNNLAAHTYAIKNKTFESTVGVPREDIEDDKIGVYAPMVQQLGWMSKLHPDALLFGLLKAGFDQKCFDGQYFFDTDHPVGVGDTPVSVSNVQAGAGAPWFLLDTSKMVRPLIFQKRRDYKLTALNKDEDQNVFMHKEFVYGVDARVNAGYGMWQFAFGSKAALDAANYAAARAAMRAFKADNGQPLHVSPNVLVVPPALEDAARKLLIAQQDAAGASNVYAGTAELIVSSWLI